MTIFDTALGTAAKTAMVTLLTAVLSNGVAAQGPETGRALAERWCVSCHIIDRTSQTGSVNGIPSFPAIAAQPATTAASLDKFLSAPHGRMPDFSLGVRERSALVDYFLALRRAAP